MASYTLSSEFDRRLAGVRVSSAHDAIVAELLITILRRLEEQSKTKKV